MIDKNLTPLFQQYYGLKEDFSDCLVLMQCGDFYEAYGEDAKIFARDLEIVLTAKDGGGGQKIPMAGIPLHSLDYYLRGLVNKGHRVAVAEQMANPADCKGLVPREVTRIVTAGTILDLQSLDEKDHNYLIYVFTLKNKLGLAAADIGTGDLWGSEFELNSEQIIEEILRFQPSEIILSGDLKGEDIVNLREKLQSQLKDVSIIERIFNLNLQEASDLLKREFALASLDGLGFANLSTSILALAGMLNYIKGISFKHKILLKLPRLLSYQGNLILDTTTRRNLELVETLLGRERKGSLLEAIDKTCTSMGARKLKDLLLRPLTDIDSIRARHDQCEILLESSEVRRQLREELRNIIDIERLLARVSYGTFNARELLGVGLSLTHTDRLSELLSLLNNGAFIDMARQLEKDRSIYHYLSNLLQEAINPEAPLSLREGNIIKDGYNAQLDELRNLKNDGKMWISRLEERERESTGIKNLKVGYNSVFGYYIEVTKSNIKSVPVHYTRRQTLVNSERYIIPELKEHEVKVLGAEEQIKKLEYNLFQDLRQIVAKHSSVLRRLADIAAYLDVLSSFAQVAQERDWVRPQMMERACVDIVEGRHPVVERVLGEFVPNDCHLQEESPLIILTGPNMSGKSTWLRQVAEIAILAQMGSFVPAKSAKLSVFDRIFTRVGASDDLHLGQSTFMVEMNETANIVNNATSKSLVILDEIGRGTSTFDGLAIAQAVVEYLHDGAKPLTLFATHFHELTKLGRTLKGCRNFRVAVKELPEKVVFLHKIVPGGADRSYGIYVAKLAGMPEPLLKRSEALLKKMESNSRRSSKVSQSDGEDLFA